jgi:hypothetical protein
MKIGKKILAGAAVLGMTLTGAAIGEETASASTVPVMYGSAAALPWHGYVKPGNFYFGQGVAPELRNLNWTSWNGTSAQGTGKLWTVKPGCVPPTYKCAFNTRYVQVTLTTVHSRNGTRYYAHMAVRFYYGGKWRSVVGWLGSNGFWTFPLVFPYL